MENFESLAGGIIQLLKDHERALLELESRLNNLDDRLEHFRLEALAVSKATWAQMAADAKDGRLLMSRLQSSATRIKRAGLLLLETRLPDKAARLDAMPDLLKSLLEI